MEELSTEININKMIKSNINDVDEKDKEYFDNTKNNKIIYI